LKSGRKGQLIPSTGLKARIRLEIGIEIRLDFDQSKQSSPNLRLVFFLLNPISISIFSLIRAEAYSDVYNEILSLKP